jgi:hypothetical protein
MVKENQLQLLHIKSNMKDNVGKNNSSGSKGEVLKANADSDLRRDNGFIDRNVRNTEHDSLLASQKV